MITCMRIFHCRAIFCWALPSRWRRILQIPRAASCLPDLLSCLQDLLGRTFYSGFTQAAPPQAARVCMTCLPGSKTPVKISSPIFYHCPCKMNKGSPAGPNHQFFFTSSNAKIQTFMLQILLRQMFMHFSTVL